MAEEDVELRPDPLKLFLVTWGGGLFFLGIWAFALYHFRSSLPAAPEPLILSLALTAVYVCFSTTRDIIFKETSRSMFNRAPAFRDETAWDFIITFLLIVQIGIGVYFVWHSWRWLVLVLLLNFLLSINFVIQFICWQVLITMVLLFRRFLKRT